MRGIRTFISSAILLASAGFAGAQSLPEYLPLRVGNSWVYQVTQGRVATEPQTIEVEAQDRFGGEEYYRVRFFGRTVWLRVANDGSLVSYDPDAKREKPWIRFGAPGGESFPAEMDTCTNTGRIEARETKVTAPLGEFSNVLRASFRGPCADAGTTEQDYLPYVGSTLR